MSHHKGKRHARKTEKLSFFGTKTSVNKHLLLTEDSQNGSDTDLSYPIHAHSGFDTGNFGRHDSQIGGINAEIHQHPHSGSSGIGDPHQHTQNQDVRACRGPQ
ncbi:Hypothetical predicted protein [Pelobates cultripes]|uniref:Uncharacterized protein n=1 Tax=Pelobates cultripes TaxID=61616 RepID=A0AAD1W0V7_PELCU|nr:Hypothetical predicted protein [Pelobates cultripes]